VQSETDLSHGTRRRGFRSRWADAAALLAGILAALVLLECGLRIFEPFPVRVLGDRISLAVDREWRYQGPAGSLLDPVIVHRRNNIGFRGEVYLPSQDSLRLFVVGGSTTACTYLSEGKTWPDRLRQQLRESFPSIWLNNAGLDGHSTFAHQILLRDHLARYQPDVLLFLAGINDMGRGDLAKSGRSRVRQRGLAAAFERSEVAALANALIRSRLARERRISHNTEGLKKSWLVDWELDPNAVSSIVSAADAELDAYRERLHRLVREGQELGAGVVLLTQPALYGPGIDDRTQLDLGAIYVDGVDGETAWEMLERYNDMTRSVAKTAGIPLIDLASTMVKSSRFYYDTIHFTNEGADRVAALVYQELCPFLAARFPDRLSRSCGGSELQASGNDLERSAH
jgi:lysophospholipase L1-like esterase